MSPDQISFRLLMQGVVMRAVRIFAVLLCGLVFSLGGYMVQELVRLIDRQLTKDGLVGDN